MNIKVMTYNICSGRDFESAPVKKASETKFNLCAAANVIKKYDPDIVGLNEVRGEGEHELFTPQAQILSELTGMKYYFFGPAIEFDGKNPYGNALLSKYPIVSAKVVGIPDPLVKDEDAYYETRGVIEAEIDVNGELIKVYVTHFGLAKAEQRNAVSTVVDLMKNESNPSFFMGDLNMQPDNEILAPIFDLLTDSADKIVGDTLTFASFDPKIKIDYIFSKNDVKFITAAPLDEMASDHRPYMVTAEI